MNLSSLEQDVVLRFGETGFPWVIKRTLIAGLRWKDATIGKGEGS